MDTVDNPVFAGQSAVFYPPTLWAAAGGQPGPSVDERKVLHTPCTGEGRLLPSVVPRFTRLSHSPTRHLGVTPFTRPGERACFVAEQWTEMWRSWGSLGTTGPSLWAAGGQLRCTACGSFLRPQAVDNGCPQIHSRLTWPDRPSRQPPVDTIWTTSQSPGCGREKVPESVEEGRNPACNRTAGELRATSVRPPRGPHRARTSLEDPCGGPRRPSAGPPTGLPSAVYRSPPGPPVGFSRRPRAPASRAVGGPWRACRRRAGKRRRASREHLRGRPRRRRDAAGRALRRAVSRS